jgi:hypothetical protein
MGMIQSSSERRHSLEFYSLDFREMRNVIPAEWTAPSFWNVAESGSRLDTIACVALSWIVNVTAHVALIFAHVSHCFDPTACSHDNSTVR